ncbi:PAS domain-containing protein [Actinomycetospora straminea]|uniref:PAS fold-4 domain-containing protein n=1 Tax=Actinomycetospora straminea TaxID=663607 RepID=A0ABP9E9F6_9PSEU|nr:PAS domain-containing protein [Actinomycetospora straminea]MDD7936054.1 PAS domain-containing protein [Actinomycetospora straminea]
MIKRRDLAAIPDGTVDAVLRSDRLAVTEQVAQQLTRCSLDRVQRVLLRLLARAGLSDPETRQALRAEADELDAAVRAARDVLFASSGGIGRPPDTTPGRRRAAEPVVEEPVETALLDTTGVIVWVNRAWCDFCLANGGDPATAGVGRSFLALCDAAGDPPSATVAAAIRAALQGDLPAPARVEVPCDAPGRPRVFDVLVSTRRDDHGDVLGATVTLSEVVRVPDGR